MQLLIVLAPLFACTLCQQEDLFKENESLGKAFGRIITFLMRRGSFPGQTASE